MTGHDLAGTVALVTGGSRGIGKAIALRLARAKVEVAINFFQDRAEAEKTSAEVAALGGKGHLLQADLKQEEEIRKMFSRIDQLSEGLDILVHSAASGVLRPMAELTAKEWDWVMDTNARSFLLCGREAALRMKNGGRIVALSSIGSSRTIPQYGAVGVSKAALEAITRYLAVEFAVKGIAVNAVAAGAVPTEVWKMVPHGQDLLEEVRKSTPAGRLLTPDEVAEIVFFLCTPQAGMIQGQTIVMDGGYSLTAPH
jgi:enoyl-[acyl-carrier protein] reductase III